METVLFILFQYLNENQNNDTYVQIATNMIKNIHQLKDKSLEEAAEICHCSESTLKRFCRYIGFDNWKKLRTLINRPNLVFSSEQIPFNQFLNHITENIYETHKYLSEPTLNDISRNISIAQRIVIVGFPRHLPYTIEFQAKMMMNGKMVEVVSYKNFTNTMSELNPTDFLIIISLQGNFFDKSIHKKSLEEISIRGVKTLLVTQSKKNDFYNLASYVVKCGDYGYFGEASYSLLYFFSRIEEAYRAFTNKGIKK